MTTYNTVFFIFIIITCFHTSVVTGSEKSDVSIWMYNEYNQVITSGCTKQVEGVCYYKDGDVVRVTCVGGKFKNFYLRFYRCWKGKKNYDDISKCAATKYLKNVNELTSNVRLTKKHDSSVLICEYLDFFFVSKNRMETRLVLKSDEPPTIVINNLQFNKSLSKPNIYGGKIGEKVKIVCKKNEYVGTLQWDFCENSTKGVSCFSQEDNGMQITYADLELVQEHNGTEIKCVYNNLNREKSITSVLIHLIPDSKANYRGRHLYWVIVGVGILVIITLIIIIVYLNVQRKIGQKMEQEEITYENLSSEVTIPPTFPNSAKLEEIYLKPSDCQEFNSKINDNDENTQPQAETNKEHLYSIRNSNPQHSEKESKSIKTDEPSYADLGTLPNNDVVRKDSIEYATIDFNPTYTNVILHDNNIKYFISAEDKVKKDYAETSYLEVGKLIK